VGQAVWLACGGRHALIDGMAALHPLGPRRWGGIGVAHRVDPARCSALTFQKEAQGVRRQLAMIAAGREVFRRASETMTL